MAYVLDTGFFAVIREYYPDVFPSFWRNMDAVAANGEISSVEQVLDELGLYKGQRGYLDQWVGAHREMCTDASRREAEAAVEILAIPQFRSLITQKEAQRGNPVADPFVIAKAMVAGGTVVTRELSAQKRKDPANAHIPDVCQHFNIDCITPMDFMRAKGWEF